MLMEVHLYAILEDDKEVIDLNNGHSFGAEND
jgi:hypothetical protein